MARIRHIAFAVFVALVLVATSANALDDDMRQTLEGHQISLPDDDSSYCETDEDGEIVCGEAAAKLRREREDRREDIEELLEKIAEKLKEISDSFGDFDGMPSGETVARVLWAALIAVIVFVVLLILLRAYRRYRPDPKISPSDREETLIEGLERSTRGRSADEFAAAGEYGKAVHALLLNALRHLRDEIPIIEVPSTTSREVVRAAEPPLRKHLHVLVSLAERNRFALEPTSSEDYEDALRAHEALRGHRRSK